MKRCRDGPPNCIVVSGRGQIFPNSGDRGNGRSNSNLNSNSTASVSQPESKMTVCHKNYLVNSVLCSLMPSEFQDKQETVECAMNATLQFHRCKEAEAKEEQKRQQRLEDVRKSLNILLDRYINDKL